MKRHNSGFVAGFLLAASAQQAAAVGLGEITLNSVLDEPLDARIQLRNIGELSDVEMLVGLASSEEFKVAGVDREFHLTGLRFEVDLSNSENPVIQVTSSQPISEPYLDFLVELEWPSGRLLREYTLLLDLPAFVSSKPQPKQVAAPQANRTQPSSAPADPAPVAGESYTVASGDTLWGIASRSRPDEHSVNETMAAIQQLNPAAFINGDANLLKKGAILRLPENSQIDNLLAASVLAETAEPVANFTPQAQLDEAEQAVEDSTYAEQESFETEQSQPESSGLLQLAALAPGQAEGGSAAGTEANDEQSIGAAGTATPLTDDVDVVQEELARTQRENDELKEQLANLEQQVATMERMAELESNTGAALQQAAENPVQQSTAPEQKSESSWLSWLFYPLIVILGLIIAVFLFFRNRQKDTDEDFQTYEYVNESVAQQEPEDVAPVAELEPEESETVDEHIPEPEDYLTHSGLELEDHEAINPLEQAEIYINLGNTTEAETILKTALEQDNSQSEVHLKLLELYANQGDLPQFDMQRAQLAELDNPAADHRAAELRAGLAENLSEVETAQEPVAQDNEFDLDISDVDMDQLSSDIDEIDLDDVFSEAIEEDAEELAPVESDAAEPDETPAPKDTGSEESALSSDEDFLEGAALGTDELDVGDIDVEEECATKLDLAQAYMDMGDRTGAMEILEEVINEGTTEQREKARDIMGNT